jgi:hypothetical protein
MTNRDVTDAMIDAGIEALALHHATARPDELVRAIFLAMIARASPISSDASAESGDVVVTLKRSSRRSGRS